MDVTRERRSLDVEVYLTLEDEERLALFKRLLFRINETFQLVPPTVEFEVAYEESLLSTKKRGRELLIKMLVNDESYAHRVLSFGKGRFWYRDYAELVEVYNRYFREKDLDEKITVVAEIDRYKRDVTQELVLTIINSHRIAAIKGNIVSRIRSNIDYDFPKLKELEHKIDWYEEHEVLDNLSEASIQQGRKLVGEYRLISEHDVLQYFNNLILPFVYGERGTDYLGFIESLNQCSNGIIEINRAKIEVHEDRVTVSCFVNDLFFKASELPLLVSSEFVLQLNSFLKEHSIYSYYLWKCDMCDENQLNFILMRNQYFNFYFKDYGMKSAFSELCMVTVEVNERRKRYY